MAKKYNIPIYADLGTQNGIENEKSVIDIENKNYYKAIDDYINILDGFYRLNGDNYKVSKEGKVVKSINWFEIGVLSICLTFIINIFLLRKLKVKNTFIDYEDKIDNDSLMIKTDSETIVSNIVSNQC